MKINRKKAIISLKKAHSMTDKVLKMIDDDKYCIDIIQQNLATIGLLKSANLELLQGHLNNCVKNAAQENNEKRLDIMMAELLKIMKTAQNK
jgi:DNA-binding FrmR family transcriptional regulator